MNKDDLNSKKPSDKTLLNAPQDYVTSEEVADLEPAIIVAIDNPKIDDNEIESSDFKKSRKSKESKSKESSCSSKKSGSSKKANYLKTVDH